MPGPVCVFDARAGLGESPVWCPRERVLWWVDIVGPSLNRFDPANGRNRSWPMPEAIGCIGLRERGGVVAALRSGFSFVDPADGRVTPIADPGHDRATTRFNDGRCDRAGRFWAGTMYEPRDRTAAALYRLDAGLSVVRVAGEVIVANGLAFSPDDRIMYWSDSRQAIVWAFDFNLAAGTIANRRVLRRFAPAEGRPDGAAVDAEGFYWSALYDGGRVVRIDPRSGAIVREIALPVRCPTMPAFGGQDLKTIFVTSARHDRPTDELARQPLAGAIFAIDVDVPGLPEPRFAG